MRRANLSTQMLPRSKEWMKESGNGDSNPEKNVEYEKPRCFKIWSGETGEEWKPAYKDEELEEFEELNNFSFPPEFKETKDENEKLMELTCRPMN